MSGHPPITVLVCALGGEGGGVLAEWLYTAAVRAGLAAQATSIPGVAQRTGATTYYIEVAAQPGGQPRFSLSPVPGGVDLLVSSELLETLRQAAAGLVAPQRTRVISSTARALTVAEKMTLGDGRYDAAAGVQALRQHSQALTLLDLEALARQAETAPSAVLLGAIAGSSVLPLARSHFEDAIRAAGKGVQPSLRGFALAYELVSAGATAVPAAPAAPAAVAMPPASEGADLRALGRRKVAAYQDEAYARLYDERLARLAAAEGGAPGPATHEAARWLALWMAFDDIVQVARLKLAASRLARLRREVNAAPGDIVKVYDHFKPGVPEIAGLLGPRLAARLQAWDCARVARGHEPFAVPLKLGTHGLVGTLALRTVAALRPLRRRGQRFALEQQLIEQWLAAVEQGCREAPALGLELARCGRLVKGYGSTNERGKEHLLHLVHHLARGSRPAAERAEAVRSAREAALADDAGRALDATLQAHGASPRPLREQPVRWYKRRPLAPLG